MIINLRHRLVLLLSRLGEEDRSGRDLGVKLTSHVNIKLNAMEKE